VAARLGRPPSNLKDFPSYVLPEAVPLLRVHRAANKPWWFASGTGNSNEGRFDLNAPYGTCYLGEEVYGAILEAFQNLITPSSPIADAEVKLRCISTLHLPVAVRLADCTSQAARGHYVTAEIHTSKNRRVTQGWAMAFRRDGFDGVRFLASNDTSLKQISIALFNDAGEQDWPVAASHPITPTLLEVIEERYGVKVR
jgi:RES domain